MKEAENFDKEMTEIISIVNGVEKDLKITLTNRQTQRAQYASDGQASLFLQRRRQSQQHKKK